jgi:hypothetical protein
MTRNLKKSKAGKRAGREPSGSEVVRRYAKALARLRDDGSNGYDDLPGVEIAPPAVRPKDVKPEQIRRAVRKAVLEFSERHGKALARS